jgi:hypothetical protein
MVQNEVTGTQYQLLRTSSLLFNVKTRAPQDGYLQDDMDIEKGLNTVPEVRSCFLQVFHPFFSLHS